MKFAIIGAGGIGCYYGARLVLASYEVDFIARGAHLEALKTDGLQVSHESLTFNEKVNAMSAEECWKKPPSSYDVLIVCVKASQTSELAQDLKSWLLSHQVKPTDAPLVLSLQNGIENEQQITAETEVPVVGGIARRIGAHITSPGVVEAVGPAQVILGGWPNESASLIPKSKLESLCVVLNAAKVPTEYSSDIKLELWRKLIINNGVNALAALVEEKTGVITRDIELSKIIKGLMREAAKAAESVDVFLSDGDVNKMFDLIYTFDSIKPSMLVDREKGRPLELDEICGVVITGCEKQGLDAPYTRTVYSVLRHMIEKQIID